MIIRNQDAFHGVVPICGPLTGYQWRFPAIKFANLPITLQWVILQNPDILGRMYQGSVPLRDDFLSQGPAGIPRASLIGPLHDRCRSEFVSWRELREPTDKDCLPLGPRSPSTRAHADIHDCSDVRRLRLLITRPCGNTAHSVVPACRVAGSDRISNVPPSCLSLALMAGMPTPGDITPLPRFA